MIEGRTSPYMVHYADWAWGYYQGEDLADALWHTVKRLDCELRWG